MPSIVFIGGRSVSLNPKQMIGSGGEADIYKIGGDMAVKIYKTPNHPDYDNLPIEQEGARQRILVHQRKLRDIPQNVPSRVITPVELATENVDPNSQILGYEMHLVKNAQELMNYTKRDFRSSISTDLAESGNLVINIFLDMYPTVDQIHKSGVVIGDYNDLNVLVSGTEAYFIDFDSCQWGPYFCPVFTAKFVDPQLCDPNATAMKMIKHHNEGSDWYAFNVMLFQSLLFVDPYGGVYKPKNPANKMVHSARPMHRVTVFNPEVVYPKPALHFGLLPDDILQHFHQCFEKDVRVNFPLAILKNLHWTKCVNCGAIHARSKCPSCDQTAPRTIKEKEIIQTTGKKIQAVRDFQTSGKILYATFQNGKLCYLYQNQGENCFRREDDSIVANGTCDPLMRFRISGEATLIAKGNILYTLINGKKSETTTVDCFGNLPMFDANEHHRYWLQNGELKRDGDYGPETIGSVLEDQTLFWVGSKFGFGFYKAGEICFYFIFNAERRGINDTVKLPRLTGQLLDSTCVFTPDRCWFFTTTQQRGKTINQCWIIKENGTILGTASATAGDGSWLGTIRGKMVDGNYLLTATDDGIVRVQPNGQGQIEVTQEFPDTEPFVDSTNYLLPGQNGLTVLKSKEVWTIRIL